MAIKFNGIEIPSFVKVNSITSPILPPISQTTIEVLGRPGSYDFGNKLDNKRFEIEVSIVANSPADLLTKKRQLAEWLYYEDAKELVILDEPDKTHFAKVSGDTDLEEIFRVGKGTLTFICTDPFAYGEEKHVGLTFVDETPAVVTNNSQLEAYPKLHFEFTQATPEFGVFLGDEYLYFGRPAQVDTYTPTDTRTLILHDDCTSVAGYTSGIQVDGGVIAGTLESTGGYIRAADFGQDTYTTWHGAAGVKTLGQSIQDFTFEAKVGFKSVYGYQIARLEIYLLDINNNIIGKFAIKDSNSLMNPIVEARAGAQSGGRYFANHWKTTGYYKYFGGILKFQRIGKQYVFTVARINDATGELYNIDTYKFYDTSGQYQVPLAGFQIHFGAYADHPPYSTFYIEDIKVWQENTIDPVTEVPNVFVPGDVLEVDCSSGVVTKNGEPYYADLDPSSTFFSLKRGDNSITVSPQVVTNASVVFRERWY